MAQNNRITFYDLQLSTGATISPFVWATKYALAHKGFELDVVPGGFTGIMERTGGKTERLPAIVDDGRWVLAGSPDRYPTPSSIEHLIQARFEGLAEESYREGRESILFVLGAQRDVQQIQLDYLQSLSSLQAAFAALEEIVGAPLD